MTSLSLREERVMPVTPPAPGPRLGLLRDPNDADMATPAPSPALAAACVEPTDMGICALRPASLLLICSSCSLQRHMENKSINQAMEADMKRGAKHKM